MGVEIDVSIKPFTARWLQQQIKRYLADETSINLHESIRQVTCLHKIGSTGLSSFDARHGDFSFYVKQAILDYEYGRTHRATFLLHIAALAYQELPNDD